MEKGITVGRKNYRDKFCAQLSFIDGFIFKCLIAD